MLCCTILYYIVVEAEYTFRLQKDIVPLVLQPRYRADGWLGALCGNKLYFDFSKEEKICVSLNALVKELGDRGKLTDNSKPGQSDGKYQGPISL